MSDTNVIAWGIACIHLSYLILSYLVVETRPEYVITKDTSYFYHVDQIFCLLGQMFLNPKHWIDTDGLIPLEHAAILQPIKESGPKVLTQNDLRYQYLGILKIHVMSCFKSFISTKRNSLQIYLIHSISHGVNKNIKTWLLIGWQHTASQSEARFENSAPGLPVWWSSSLHRILSTWDRALRWLGGPGYQTLE